MRPTVRLACSTLLATSRPTASAASSLSSAAVATSFSRTSSAAESFTSSRRRSMYSCHPSKPDRI
eukprot:CAMPEP_0180136046 /NCGR_PEP_ID=MMETSP0986-20121125/11231_1 /TAXON_ID=697907 /ORGANISM="non described non described, Strain CCMP2293" /LENGTH=64 /DNA_ID=CAMNT_0022076937 /DNA_START=105 /DNA_END=296 /DNA_ORIENTATION=+